MATYRRLRVGTIIVGLFLIVGSLLLWNNRVLPADDALGWLDLVVKGSFVLMGSLLVVFAVFDQTRTPRPLAHTDVLSSALPAVAVREVIEGYVAEAGGTFTGKTDAHIGAQFGSQLALRLMGVMTQFGVDRLPYRLEADINEAPPQTVVRLAFTSNEGWYLGRRTKMADRAYAARFAYVTTVLRARLNL